ncbi:Deoxyribonuclease CdtB [Glaesserella parasuis]|nr:Deoxyribonuclease CdtB [Glaesserella parasuis]
MASEVFVIDSGSAVLTSRPAIGIQIDNDAFFSIHALSSGGSDSLRLIRNIFEFFNTPERQHINWMAVGDFNRSPGRMQEALNEEPGLSNATLIVAPTEPTHRSGNVLWGTDYFCIERKKKIWVEKMRWGFVWWGLPHFLLGRVMQKVKWAKMVENGQFLQYFLHRFEQV